MLRRKRILKTNEPTMTTTTYRAVQVSKPGNNKKDFELLSK
jgi:hypothetical protein